MHLSMHTYVLDIQILFIALFAISKRWKVQKKATVFFPSCMFSLLPSGLQTLGMAPLVKNRRSRRNSKAEKAKETPLLLPTDNHTAKSIFSFPFLITSYGVKSGVIQAEHNTT